VTGTDSEEDAPMKERLLRRRCRRLLRELDIRPPLEVPALCARLAERRGRAIRLVPYPIETPGPFGLWFMTDSADVVFYQQETTRPHQDHIILHEIGHIIAEHRSDAAIGGSSGGVLPDGLRRTCYDSGNEREAELIATIILEWASVLNRLYAPGPEGESQALERLGDSLANHRGWL
jgi:Zn-dependent peptidase ImmA (M78 family)